MANIRDKTKKEISHLYKENHKCDKIDEVDEKKLEILTDIIVKLCELRENGQDPSDIPDRDSRYNSINKNSHPTVETIPLNITELKLTHKKVMENDIANSKINNSHNQNK